MGTTLARDERQVPIQNTSPYRTDWTVVLDGMSGSVSNDPNIYDQFLKLTSWGGDNFISKSTDGFTIALAGNTEVEGKYVFASPTVYASDTHIIYNTGTIGWFCQSIDGSSIPYANPSTSSDVPLTGWLVTGSGTLPVPTLVTTVVPAVLGEGLMLLAGTNLNVVVRSGEVISTINGKLNITPMQDKGDL
jgi:hypothetical protein